MDDLTHHKGLRAVVNGIDGMGPLTGLALHTRDMVRQDFFGAILLF